MLKISSSRFTSGVISGVTNSQNWRGGLDGLFYNIMTCKAETTRGAIPISLDLFTLIYTSKTVLIPTPMVPSSFISRTTLLFWIASFSSESLFNPDSKLGILVERSKDLTSIEFTLNGSSSSSKINFRYFLVPEIVHTIFFSVSFLFESNTVSNDIVAKVNKIELLDNSHWRKENSVIIWIQWIVLMGINDSNKFEPIYVLSSFSFSLSGWFYLNERRY